MLYDADGCRVGVGGVLAEGVEVSCIAIREPCPCVDDSAWAGATVVLISPAF
jgi:hypothetical protein